MRDVFLWLKERVEQNNCYLLSVFSANIFLSLQHLIAIIQKMLSQILKPVMFCFVCTLENALSLIQWLRFECTASYYLLKFKSLITVKIRKVVIIVTILYNKGLCVCCFTLFWDVIIFFKKLCCVWERRFETCFLKLFELSFPYFPNQIISLSFEDQMV